VITPEQFDVLVKVCVVMGAVGVACILVGWLVPKLLDADRVVNEARDEVAQGRLSDPDLMAVAKHVGGREYRP
jgi:hypothetical protein